MRNHNLVSYETIVRATSGEPEAVEERRWLVSTSVHCPTTKAGRLSARL